jgi:Tfp pilus assembly protein FimV
MKHKLIILALVFSLVFVSQDTFSLGMGKIQVNSALDEPLNASIDIIANNDEAIEQVSAKLASSDDYKKVGLDKSFVPANIMVSVDEDNPYQINVRSNGPVSEPIVSLLLDVTWANGRILREFTLLLDPPSYQTSTIGSVSMPVTESEPAQQEPETMADVQDDAVTAQSDDIPPVSQDLNQPDEDIMTEGTEQDQDDNEFAVETPMEENVSETLSVMPGEIYVDSGDTLWRIANQNKPGDVTTHQMMMAIYNKNPNAFLNNNINEMIKGSTLQMPDADSAEYISYQEALAQFESHNSRWANANDSYSSFQTESQVDDSETVADTTDYGVQLSGGEGDDADSQQTEGDLAESGNAGLSDEEAFNTGSENEELKSRVSELESIVDEQQSALELQDDDMANLENQMAQDPTEEDTLTEGDFDAVTEDDETLADDTMDDDVWGSDVTQDETLDETSDSMTESDEQGMDEDPNTSDSLDEAEPSEELNEDVSEEEGALVATPSQPPVRVSEPWYTPVMNWIEQNILWVIIGLVVLFLIVLLPRLFNRGDEDPAEESSFLDDIKSSRGKQEAESFDDNDNDNELDEDEETVLTSPISVDGDDDNLDSFETDDDQSEEYDEDDDDDDDVLATLDNSLAFV